MSKGVASVSSPVTRLREHSFTIDHLPFCNAVIQEYKKSHPNIRNPLYFTMDEYNSNSEIQKYHQELVSWDWIYGQTPYFSQTIEKVINNQLIKIVISVKHGLIQEIESDHPTSKFQLIQEFRDKWLNHKYEDAIKHMI